VSHHPEADISLLVWRSAYTVFNYYYYCYYSSVQSLSAYFAGLISNENATSISAGILLALAILYFVLENFVFEKYLRYMFTIYPVLIFAFSGVIYKLVTTGGSRQNIIIASVNISICSALFITRIALSVYRFKHRQTNASSKNEKQNLGFEQI